MTALTLASISVLMMAAALLMQSVWALSAAFKRGEFWGKVEGKAVWRAEGYAEGYEDAVLDLEKAIPKGSVHCDTCNADRSVGWDKCPVCMPAKWIGAKNA